MRAYPYYRYHRCGCFCMWRYCAAWRELPAHLLTTVEGTDERIPHSIMSICQCQNGGNMACGMVSSCSELLWCLSRTPPPLFHTWRGAAVRVCVDSQPSAWSTVTLCGHLYIEKPVCWCCAPCSENGCWFCAQSDLFEDSASPPDFAPAARGHRSFRWFLPARQCL